MEFIRVEKLNFHYKCEKEIIKNLNFSLDKDEITIITGENGSGKSTLGKLLMGILKPISGHVFIQDENISQMSLAQIGNRIGYLFQNPEKQLFGHTVQEELSFVLKSKGFNMDYIEDRVSKLLETFQLEDLRNSFPLKLSQGEKQRLAIAAILVNDVEYLILDEPTTGLDIYRREILCYKLKELNQNGIGMAVISHDKDFIDSIGDREMRFDRGEIVEDRRE